MDFFDRIARLIDSALEDVPPGGSEEPGGRLSGDWDYHEAWQELDDYLRGAEAHYRGEAKPAPESGIPPEVLQAYRDLEISPYASLDEVREAYRRLLRRYHPDKFAQRPAKQQLATEIAARLNDSYARIQRYLGKY